MLVLAATNRRDMVGPALLRPGRFDAIIELPAPDEGARLAIFKIHTRGKPLARDVDLAQMARDSANRTGAHIAAVCHKASLVAIREFLGGGKSSGKGTKGFVISNKHFIEAAEQLTARGS